MSPITADSNLRETYTFSILCYSPALSFLTALLTLTGIRVQHILSARIESLVKPSALFSLNLCQWSETRTGRRHSLWRKQHSDTLEESGGMLSVPEETLSWPTRMLSKCKHAHEQDGRHCEQADRDKAHTLTYTHGCAVDLTVYITARLRQHFHTSQSSSSPIPPSAIAGLNGRERERCC